jgi:hypothetical protein
MATRPSTRHIGGDELALRTARIADLRKPGIDAEHRVTAERSSVDEIDAALACTTLTFPMSEISASIARGVRLDERADRGRC